MLLNWQRGRKMKINSLNEFQGLAVKIVKDLDKIRDINHDKDVTMHHLTEELGEIAREIFNDKTGRDNIDRENLKGEIIDIMVLASHLAYLHDIELEDALQFKLNNFKERFNLEV